MKNSVSVVIPTYNRKKIVKRAIDSVINQTYENWEVIIADDASTDGTEEFVREHYQDSRIKFFKNQMNGGNASARNLGVAKSNGNYVAFLDSDDEFDPFFLEKVVRHFEENQEADFLWTGTKYFDSQKEIKSHGFWSPRFEDKKENQFLYELKIGTGCGLVIKKKCFENLLFDENIRSAVDTDFLIRLRMKYNYSYIKEELINIYDSFDSVRKQRDKQYSAYNIIIAKHKGIINNDQFLIDKWYGKLFWLSLYCDDEKSAVEIINCGLLGAKIKFKAYMMYFVYRFLGIDAMKYLHRKVSNVIP